MTEFPTEAAIFLLNRYYDFTEANGPKARDVANARLEAACAMAHALGYGWTPSHVRGIVTDACHANGPRPQQTAYNRERKAHQEATVTTIIGAFRQAA